MKEEDKGRTWCAVGGLQSTPTTVFLGVLPSNFQPHTSELVPTWLATQTAYKMMVRGWQIGFSQI
jgi:hypothetical protein